ncbi:hypothetical protein ACK8P5_26285 (plasmid) [Paenibacillus sp. EC2-1]|uniref:hypothetical protein n=1 Tax=Paenibacillus sp. EC2-1 TaxID=3388665 RepID=UPI003BEECE47
MNSRSFKSISGRDLTIRSRRSAVIFEKSPEDLSSRFSMQFSFEPEVFAELIEYIEDVASKSWPNLQPVEARNLSSDYHEYYDREFGNNGYLSIRGNALNFDRPSLQSDRLYQFDKRKMASFVYDLLKLQIKARNKELMMQA